MSRRRWLRGRRRRPEAIVEDEPERKHALPANPSPGPNSGLSDDNRARGADGRWLPQDTTERFRSSVERVGECLLWTGDLDKDGYGRFKVKVDGRWVHVAAHVWAWTQEHGPVPAGHTLDHLCHSSDSSCRGLGRRCPHRRCIDTDHLEPVPTGENQRRARARSNPMSQFADSWTPDPDGWRRHVYEDGTVVEYGPEAPCDHEGCDEEICQDDDYLCEGCRRHFCDDHLYLDGDTELCRTCHPGPLPEGDPILVDCEGTCERPVDGACPACGRLGLVIGGYLMGHQRDDFVARFERGDYDYPEAQ